MNRLPFLLVACLSAPLGVVATVGDEPDGAAKGNSIDRERLVKRSVLSPSGKQGERVRELQLTLNFWLRNQTITLPIGEKKMNPHELNQALIELAVSIQQRDPKKNDLRICERIVRRMYRLHPNIHHVRKLVEKY